MRYKVCAEWTVEGIDIAGQNKLAKFYLGRRKRYTCMYVRA